MKVLYTILAAAGWAWLAVAGALLLAAHYQVFPFSPASLDRWNRWRSVWRSWRRDDARGFDVIVDENEK